MNLPINSLLVAFSSATNALAQWLIVVFLGRLEGPVVLGSYSLAQSWVLVISYFTMLAFRQQVLAGNLRSYNFSTLLFVRVVFSLLIFAPFLMAVWFFSDALFSSLFFCAIFYKFSDLLVDLISVWYQYSRRFVFLALSSVFRFVFILSFFGVAYYFGFGLIVAFVSLLLGSVVFVFLFDYRFLNLGYNFISRTSFAVFFNIVRNNFWFAASNVLMVLAFALLRQLIDYFAGGVVLGYFSASFQIITLISFFVTAVGQVLLPRFGEYFRSGLWYDFRLLLFKILALFFVFGGLISFLVFLFGGEIIFVIYGAGFEGGYKIFVSVFLSAIPMYLSSIVGASAYAIGSKSVMLRAYLYSLVMLLFFGVVGGYLGGVDGILVAFSFVMIFQVLYFYFSIKRLIRVGGVPVAFE